MAQVFGEPFAEARERRSTAALVVAVEVGRVGPEGAVQAVGARTSSDVRRQIQGIQPYCLIPRKRVGGLADDMM